MTSGAPMAAEQVAEQVAGRVADSLALTVRAVAALDDAPVVLTSGPGSAYPDPGPLDANKVVGEALLLLRATRGAVAGTPARAVWRSLLGAVAPLARPESLPTTLCLDPANALEHAFAHLQLSALGDRDPCLDLLLELALAEPVCGPEAYVVPALQRAWLGRLRVEAQHDAHDAHDGREVMDSLVERSSLARPVDLLRCTMQDVYDLTHAVMHGTDLGRWSTSVPRPVDALVADLDALLGFALDAENLDLTAELLWSWPMLMLPWTPTARFAFDVLSRVHDEHGFLPGPGFDRRLHANLPAPAAAAYVLRTSYHASLVFGMLCAAMLTEGSPAPATTSTTSPARTAGSGRRLLELIDPEPPRTWRRLLRSAPDAAVDADLLAPMLLALALRRASDRSDLPRIGGLLALAIELDLADGQVVRQAVSLLRRVAALARATPSHFPAAPTSTTRATPARLPASG